ncbi:hypothetical protein SLA2020_311110 [Shorea laevis]
MPEIQLGIHTIRSHGAKVARVHLHDWLILPLLIVLFVILEVIEPFHRFVGKDMMTDLSYPMKDNTVPFWAVPMIAILLPLCVILVYYFIRKDVFDLHQAILGLLFSILITAVITNAIKDAVGRPRPDFFWRCFPNGTGVFNNVTGDVICNGLKSVIKEGHKSFPSGHASASFAGLGFLALYLSGKIQVFDRRGHIAKLCIVFLPLLVAALVGISRVNDYWHHWQDVFAGGLLGTTVATFCYLQFFPPPYDVDGWGPYAYFQMLAESQGDTRPNNTSSVRVNQSELESVFVDSHNGMEIGRENAFETSHIVEGTREVLEEKDTGNRRRVKVIRLGGTASTGRWIWKIRVIPKLRLRMSSSLFRFLARFHDASVDMMIRVANNLGKANGGGLFGGKKIAKGQHVAVLSGGEEVDSRLVMETHKRLAASREFRTA